MGPYKKIREYASPVAPSLAISPKVLAREVCRGDVDRLHDTPERPQKHIELRATHKPPRQLRVHDRAENYHTFAHSFIQRSLRKDGLRWLSCN